MTWSTTSVERFARIDDDRVFRFFERRELAFHQFFREKMGGPMLQPVTDCFRIDVEIDKCRAAILHRVTPCDKIP